MKLTRCNLSFSLTAVVISAAAYAQTATDVPKTHWASSAVADVVSHGVMPVSGGKFEGDRPVTRTELTVTLAKFARSLEKGAWPKIDGKPVKSHEMGASDAARPVTRYELAALISRIAGLIVKGLPSATGKTFNGSEALPDRPKITVPKADPAYESVAYLVKNRMAFGASVALRPGPAKVTPKETSDAIAIMIAGLNDRLTDELQNKEDPGSPPKHKD
jgi:hypothetical protein